MGVKSCNTDITCIMYKIWGITKNVINSSWIRWIERWILPHIIPDSKVHGANMGPIWGRQDPGEPHVGPMNFAIWDRYGDLTLASWRLRSPEIHNIVYV